MQEDPFTHTPASEEGLSSSEQPEHEPAGQPSPSDSSPGQTTSSIQPSLPPEAQGEANGGPLGCCLGVTVGLILTLSVAVIGRLYANSVLPFFHSPLLVLILLRILMAIFAIAGAIFFGYFGWKIGQKMFREYEPPVVKYRTYKKPKIKEARTKL